MGVIQPGTTILLVERGGKRKAVAIVVGTQQVAGDTLIVTKVRKRSNVTLSVYQSEFSWDPKSGRWKAEIDGATLDRKWGSW